MADTRFRIAPRVAWTNTEQRLGMEPSELFPQHPGAAVVCVALPDGWPIILYDAQAIVWEDLVAAGERGLSVREALEPWTANSEPTEQMLVDTAGFLDQWVQYHVAERIES